MTITIKEKRTNQKGKSIIQFPDKYVVLDIETTGLSSQYDTILEIGAIKVENQKIVAEYQQLINPKRKIDPMISNLTHITDAMVEDAPFFEEIADDFLNFIENDIILGHNVSFDINFLYDHLQKQGLTLSNDYIDLLRIARKLSPELENHKLMTVSKSLDISYEGAHRALQDCIITKLCFEKYENTLKLENRIDSFVRSMDSSTYTSANNIIADESKFDKKHPFYQKHCCFSGTFQKYKRKEAMQMVANIGGICDDLVTKQTDYLITENNANLENQKSRKLFFALKYQKEGSNIKIISENDFYKLMK